MGRIGLSREALRRLVYEQCSASLMSETKWRRCLPVIREYQVVTGVRSRVKLLTCSTVSTWGLFVLPAPSYIEFLPEFGPVLYLEVEWLEVELAAGGPALIERLRMENMPVTVDQDLLRVLGHVR